MNNDRNRKRLPPYISYRTFHNFIDGLQQVIPARIDRSYWGDRLSGSTGTQLMAALRFLGLIDTSGMPTSRLRLLVAARGDRKAEILKEIASEAFGFLLKGPIDPETATYAQLEEGFHRTFELSGDVSRKCIKFFVALANDAEIPLSPFIAKKVRSIHSGTGTKAVAKRQVRTKQDLLVPQTFEEIPDQISWDKMLLTKFPTFDPTWSDEVKLKWFEAFDELLKRSKGEK